MSSECSQEQGLKDVHASSVIRGDSGKLGGRSREFGELGKRNDERSLLGSGWVRIALTAAAKGR
eukprot:880862-Amphidinium_carterae.1